VSNVSGRDSLSASEALRDIVLQLRNSLEGYRELGFDPPPVRIDDLNNPKQEDAASQIQEAFLRGIRTLDTLQDFIGDCRRCSLHRGRKQLVFGAGSPTARLMFIGEGPGRDEDMVGKPFVGEAGRLLNKIIAAMGLRREEVYIGNVVKCRPPKNREPEGNEIDSCLPFLKQQIQIVRPEVICLLGRIAGRALLGEGFVITKARGKWHSFRGIPLMPTYHPAYLLRNVSAKRVVWEDVQEIMKKLGLKE
jgi:DNA polymerase